MMTAMTTTEETAPATMTDRPTGRRLLLSRYSVRTRITATVGVLVALALSATGLLVYALGLDRVEDTVRRDVDQELAELEEFEETGRDLRTGQPFTSLQRLVREFLLRNVPSESELMLGIWDGEVQYASASAREALLDDVGFLGAVLPKVRTGGAGGVDTQWGEVYYEVLPLRDAERDGAFVVAFFVQDELTPLHEIMRSYTIAALIALGLVTAVAARQAGRLLAPVRTLRRTAEEIGETDLSRRIPVTGNDDLTDLTRTVNAMLTRLERAFAGQRAFLDDAGHELRTPLTILRGHLELLDVEDAKDVAATRELLLDEVDRMSRLVDDMILLTKADRPGFLSPAPVDVDALVAAVAGKVRGLGDRQWEIDGYAGGVVEVDEQRITQALLQLAHNAVKHTGEGDVVALGAAALGDRVRLWVRDTGPGVPGAEKETIFRRFARGADEAADEGVGLGLAIVAAIVLAHGGDVSVEDAAPHGACFVVTLPRTRKDGPWPAS